jgi:hypothetical protein
MNFFRFTLLALATLAATGCATTKDADRIESAVVQGGAGHQAYVWTPAGESDSIQAKLDSFIMVVTRTTESRDGSMVRLSVEDDFTQFASDVGYAARPAAAGDFRSTYPIVVVDDRSFQRGPSEVQVAYRNRDHRAIVRFYVELKVAEVGRRGVGKSDFGRSFIASAM